MQNKLATLFMGITAVCLLFLSVCAIGAILVYVPKVNIVLDNVDKLSDEIDAVEIAVGNLIIASNELKKVDFKSINALVDESRQGVAAANQKIQEINIDTLNEAIQNLNDTVKPLADFLNSFR